MSVCNYDCFNCVYADCINNSMRESDWSESVNTGTPPKGKSSISGDTYYSRNREKVILYQRGYYARNKKAISEQKKEYYKAHKEFYKEKHRLYYKAHKEEIAARSHERYLKNRDLILEKCKEYHRLHKAEYDAYYREYNANRRKNLQK